MEDTESEVAADEVDVAEEAEADLLFDRAPEVLERSVVSNNALIA